MKENDLYILYKAQKMIITCIHFEYLLDKISFKSPILQQLCIRYLCFHPGVKLEHKAFANIIHKLFLLNSCDSIFSSHTGK